MVDISHPNFEDHINTVKETLKDLNSLDKATIMIFNKIDAFTYVKKDEDDLTPKVRENYSLEELMKTWMAKENYPCIFISAEKKINIDGLRDLLYETIKDQHLKIYPHRLLY